MRGVAIETTLLVAAGLVVAAQGLCQPGLSWWNSQQEICLNCTRCDNLQPPLYVLRPCEPHQDTLCAPLKDLRLDWSWLEDYRRQNIQRRGNSHNKKKHKQPHKESEDDHRRIIWRFSTLSDEENQSDEKLFKKIEPVINSEDNRVLDEKSEQKNEGLSGENYSDYDSEVEVKLGSQPLVDDDFFMWDWQTVALILAAFAFLLFFIVVAAYSVYHARQWRLLKKSLEADVEGLSAKLNLMMVPAEPNEPPDPPSPGPECHYSNIKCSYLEQLLVGKNKGRSSGPGNVYIQENNT